MPRVTWYRVPLFSTASTRTTSASICTKLPAVAFPARTQFKRAVVGAGRLRQRHARAPTQVVPVVHRQRGRRNRACIRQLGERHSAQLHRAAALPRAQPEVGFRGNIQRRSCRSRRSATASPWIARPSIPGRLRWPRVRRPAPSRRRGSAPRTAPGCSLPMRQIATLSRPPRRNCSHPESPPIPARPSAPSRYSPRLPAPVPRPVPCVMRDDHAAVPVLRHLQSVISHRRGTVNRRRTLRLQFHPPIEVRVVEIGVQRSDQLLVQSRIGELRGYRLIRCNPEQLRRRTPAINVEARPSLAKSSGRRS